MKRYLSPIVLFLAVALVIIAVVVQTNKDVAPVTGDTMVAEDTIVTDESMVANVPPQPEPAPAVSTDMGSPIVGDPQSVLGFLQASGDHTTLVQAVTASGDNVTLAGETGDITFFAPNNAAFEQVSGVTVADLMLPENRPMLQKLLQDHIVNERLTMADIESRATDGKLTVKSAAGTDVTFVRGDDNTWTIQTLDGGNAVFLTPDTNQRNGIVHMIDRVLVVEAPAAAVTDTAAPAAPMDADMTNPAMEAAPAMQMEMPADAATDPALEAPATDTVTTPATPADEVPATTP